MQHWMSPAESLADPKHLNFSVLSKMELQWMFPFLISDSKFTVCTKFRDEDKTIPK